MDVNKPFDETRLFVMSEYIYFFMKCTFFFLLFNLPLLSAMIFFHVHPASFSWMVLAFMSLFMGPAWIVVLRVTGKALREREIPKGSKLFLSSYVSHLGEGMFYWALYFISFLILQFNKLYFLQMEGTFALLAYVFTVLQLALVTCALYTFAIVSRFYLHVHQTLKLSLWLMVRKLNQTVLMFAMLILCMVLLMKLNGLLSIFIGGIGYVMMRMMQPILQEIEECIQTGKDEVE
ncbi:hypothetical protein [Bacillus sp. NPDC077027]|uniref:hypothetical protein n=1 Tax=Bacillus sp. NPDC077027 TaxID=3390548 RepID=UPI003D05220D